MTQEQEDRIIKEIKNNKSGDWGCIKFIIIWMAFVLFINFLNN
jgi:hypothetical protein